MGSLDVYVDDFEEPFLLRLVFFVCINATQMLSLPTFLNSLCVFGGLLQLKGLFRVQGIPLD